jgi:5'-3' exonuclease
MQRFLLIDTSAVIHAARYGMKDIGLSFEDEPTAIIFSFLHTLKGLYQKHRPSHTIFALDSFCSWRKELDPGYKHDREEKKAKRTEREIEADTVLNDQFNTIIRDVLPTLGFRNLFRDDGYEGDDVIGIICRSYPEVPTVIVTRDNDLWVLLDRWHRIWDYHKKAFFTENDFRSLYGINPRRWRKVKRMAGCVGDCVPGIKGIGYDRAVAFLTGKMKKSSLFYGRILQSSDIMKHTGFLTDVPHPGIREFHPERDRLSRDGLERIIKWFGMHSVERSIDEWVTIFRMQDD